MSFNKWPKRSAEKNYFMVPNEIFSIGLDFREISIYVGRKRKSGTGCISEINDHLFEGRYSPKWPDGKKHARNVYARTREECEEKLKVLIVEMKEEIAEMQRLKAEGTLPPRESEKSQKKTKKSKKNK